MSLTALDPAPVPRRRKALAYRRISDDRTGRELGVLRQAEDLTKLGELLDADVIWYVDNDRSASREGVVSVPSAAISTVGGVSTVKVRTNGVDETRTVVTGLKGDGTTEITSGLEAGDQVVMSVGVVTSSGSSRRARSLSSRLTP